MIRTQNSGSMIETAFYLGNVGYFDNMDLRKIEALWIYLELVYPVIIESNVNQAKTMSQNLVYNSHDKVAALR